MIDQKTSLNFNILKFGSIIMVFLGHYFGESGSFPSIWIAVTIGLIIFGFSSGYFTNQKYHGEYDKIVFFKKKLQRLSFNLFFINLFLFILFIFRNEPNILTWQTFINLIGMNGFLEWFFIQNVSPYGNGAWFLTLLLIFYLVYPLLEKINIEVMLNLTPLVIVSLFVISHYHRVGHALWITLCAFYLGILSSKINLSRQPNIWKLSIVAVCTSLALILVNEIFAFEKNYFFVILSFSLLFIFGFVKLNLPMMLYSVVGIFSDCLLEIYLIHSYLFIHHFSKIWIIDLLLSIGIVLLAALLLNTVSNILKTMVTSSSPIRNP